MLITCSYYSLGSNAFFTDSVVSTQKSPLKSKVKYSAKDSIRFDLENQRVYLFGDAKVTYENIELKSAYIELNLKDKLVFAEGMKDSLGKDSGLPVFSEDGHSYTSQKMMYNFETKKGRITDILTKEGEGYIHGETVKKDTNNVTYISHGSYTTCDLPQPHFAIKANKLKVIPDDKIITGPAYLVIENIPTPIEKPYGFNTNKKGQSSGILIPAYGESTNLGFFLKDGGYYFGLSDFWDLTLRGDIYSFGSWAVKTNTNYRKRYKYNGNFNLNYSKIVIGDPDLPKTSNKNEFFLRWNHVQDAKARPNSSFSANVNAGSSNYNTYNANNANAYLSNTFQSNIAYTKAWKRSNLSLNARHSQNTINRTMDISFPELTYSRNRAFPFKNAKRVEPKWYDKIGYSWITNARNELTTFDSLILQEDPFKKMRSGIKHSIPISTSFQALKYVTVTPLINGYSTWYLKTIQKKFDESTSTVKTDTVVGFKTFNEFNASLNATTRIYGMYVFKGGRLKAIRHVVTPNFGISYRPDFAKPNFGYYKSVVTNTSGNTQQYALYEGGIFGGPPAGKSGFLNWSLNNNLEAKVKSKNDTVGDKKVSIIEALSISSGYNLEAEHYKWSLISISGRTKLFNVLDINSSTTLDPYRMDSTGKRIERFVWLEEKKLGRLVNSNLSLGINLKSKQAKAPQKQSTKGSQEEMEDINRHPEAYVDFNVPWTFNIYYNLNYSKPALEKQFIQSLNFNGDFSLTPKWKIGFTSGYDFKTSDFSYTSVNVYRDLHCWEMRFNWIPFGFRQSYTVDIKVKSPVLQDLKLSRKRDWYDYQ